MGATEESSICSKALSRWPKGCLGSNSGIPIGSPSPTLLATEIPGLFPEGLCRQRQSAQDSPESPWASRAAPGGSRPTHSPFVSVRVLRPHSLARWTRSDKPVGHLVSHAQRSPRSLCAGALAPRRNTPPPFRARANPTAAHTHDHAPHRWSCPRTPSLAPAPLLDPYLSRLPCRDATPIHRAPDRPLRPVPCPAAATAAGSSSQLPGPSPTSPHAPGSQLHVTTGAAEGQSRLGGRGLGAGRARSPRCFPAGAESQGGPPLLRRHGSHQLGSGHWPSFSFLTLCSCRGCSPLGHLVARLWSLRLIPLLLAF